MKAFKVADVKIWGVFFIFFAEFVLFEVKWLTEECIMATTRHFKATD